MIDQKKILDPDGIVQALAFGERQSVYGSLKALNEEGPAAYQPYKTKAQEKGFDDLDDMVSFYTIGDSSDDAPGCKIREGLRELYAMCLEDYSGVGEDTKAVQQASNGVLVLAALRASWVPLAFAVAFLALLIWRGHPASILGLVVAIIWAISQIAFSYKQASFLQKAYNLFRKYGVHVVDSDENSKEELGSVKDVSDLAISGVAAPAESDSTNDGAADKKSIENEGEDETALEEDDDSSETIIAPLNENIPEKEQDIAATSSQSDEGVEDDQKWKSTSTASTVTVASTEPSAKNGSERRYSSTRASSPKRPGRIYKKTKVRRSK